MDFLLSLFTQRGICLFGTLRRFESHGRVLRFGSGTERRQTLRSAGYGAVSGSRRPRAWPDEMYSKPRHH